MSRRAIPGSLPVVVVALAAWAVWVGWGPVREMLAAAGSEATTAAYYSPVKRFLAARAAAGQPPVRIEVPLTRSHWEAALLAPAVSLARGWEKQLDERYNAPLLSSRLTAASYGRWLRGQAVAYVALPDARLDRSSAAEGRVIRSKPPYLRLTAASRHWRIYEVSDATPLLQGPGRLAALGHDSFALEAHSPGSFLVRVHYSRYLTVTGGSACVSQAPGQGHWTSVRALAPGTIRIQARFSLSRALGIGGASCRKRPPAAP
jgi:hypothetical protein